MGRSWSSALAVVALGCGRGNFDHLASEVPDAAPEEDAAPDASTLMAGCVLHLEMDEPAWAGLSGEVIDSCGGDDNGRAQNGATTTVGGVRGRAGLFAGDPMCVTIPDAPRLRAAAGLTMSAWVYPTGLDGVNELGILSKRTDFMVQGEYSLFLWTGDKAWVDVDTENDRFDSGVVFQNSRWQQVTVVYDGTRGVQQRVTLYVDGAEDRVAPEASAAIAPGTAPLAVGCLPLSGPAQSFIGKLDEVVIWTRALSPGEVAQWYAATKP